MTDLMKEKENTHSKVQERNLCSYHDFGLPRI